LELGEWDSDLQRKGLSDLRERTLARQGWNYRATASGEVYHLKTLKDFDGNYTAAGAGITLAGGRSAVTMSNQNGVRVRLISTNRGVDLTLGGGGVDLRLKK